MADETPTPAPLLDARVPREIDGDDDMTPALVARRRESEGDTALNDMLGRVDARQANAPENQGDVGRELGGAPGEAPPPAAAPEKKPEGPKILGSRIAGDIGVGAVEAPRQAAAGAMEALNEASDTAFSLAGWLNEHVVDLGSIEILQDLDGVDGAVEIIPGVLGWKPDAPDENDLKIPDGLIADDARTLTGGAIRGISQFLTGFAVGGRLLKGAGMAAATTTAGRTAQAAAKGAISDMAFFDAMDANLSDLIQKVPALQNPVTEYLASDPADSEAEARFKKGVEGLLGGAMFDGFYGAVRAIRSYRAAKRTAGPEGMPALDEMTEARARYGEISDADLADLGDPNGPLLNIAEANIEAAGVRPGELLGRPENTFKINMARVASAEDVQDLMAAAADRLRGSVDDARRGVQGHEATQALADDLGLTVGELLKRRRGQALNAEEALAARQLWTASSEQLLDATRKAAQPDATQADLFVFRRTMAVHHAIQAQVMGARAEAGRALNAWKIPAGGPVEKARAVHDAFEAFGHGNTQEIARRLGILVEQGATPAAISNFVRKSWGARSVDAIREVWINGLLSSPKTHVVNITSNMGVAIAQVAERFAAEGVSRAAGRAAGEGVAPGEATAMAFGTIEAVKDAFRLAWQTMKTGDQAGLPGSKIDIGPEPALTAENFNIASDSALGRFVDVVGEVARAPGQRLLAGEDAFFKSIGYRAELKARALRQAHGEGLTGGDLKRRIAEIVDNPPEDLRIAATDAALYRTFTNEPGWFADKLLRARNGGGALNPLPFILPFLRTPANIARYGFERTPLAPLVGQWRADIAAGGARADIALARMATGTAVMAAAADYADLGFVTGAGPTDPGEREALRRQGWQPYSIRVGDNWVSYNRTDPFGMTMGLAADIAEAMKRGEIDADDVDEWQETVAMGIAAIANVSISKTYLQGFAEFVQMMSDPGRYSERYISDFVASFVPFTSLSGAVETAVDPALSEINNPGDAVFARIAGLSAKLPPRRDLWGEKIVLESGQGKGFDFFAPWTTRRIESSPIDAEIQRLGASIRRISKRTSFMGTDVNLKDWPEVYDEYVRLAGNALKHPVYGKGAYDMLNAVVTGKDPRWRSYAALSDGKDGGKTAWIRKQITTFRRLAQREILADPRFAKFADFVDEKAKADRAARRPNFGAAAAPPQAPQGVPQIGGR